MLEQNTVALLCQVAWTSSEHLMSAEQSFALHAGMQMQGSELVKDLLNIEVVAVLNQAFCHLHHYKFCPHTDELIQQCGMVRFTPYLLQKLFLIHCMTKAAA